MKNKNLLIAITLFCGLGVLSSCSKKMAELSTTAPTVLAGTSVTLGGNVTADNGAAIMARGVCYATTPGPSLASPTVSAATAGSGTYSVVLDNLTRNTKYYARAWATNSNGTSYGNEINFTTATTNAPLLTAAPWLYTTYTASGGGSNTNFLTTDPCLADDITTFLANGTRTISDGANACSGSGTPTSSWILSANDTRLTLILPGGAQDYTVSELSSTALDITYSSSGITAHIVYHH